jgi:type IV pilus assembly protein PilZ
MDDASDEDRRSDVRAPIELKVEYKRLNAFFADYTKNISRGGTFIKTGRPLPIGTEFLFKLYLPHLDGPLEIHGEVQWIVSDTDVAEGKHEEAGMGIRFVYREGASREEVERTVEKLMVDSLGQRLYTRLMASGDRKPGSGGPGTGGGAGGA